MIYYRQGGNKLITIEIMEKQLNFLISKECDLGSCLKFLRFKSCNRRQNEPAPLNKGCPAHPAAPQFFDF